jgi:tRNA threonylcarbamoyladenosine biosynthesis protein TsaE
MPNPIRPVLAETTLPSPEATSRLAAHLADRLAPGDILCLDGDLGAGKTHFARSLIQHLQAAEGRVEDVPSPTFTLVQTYEAGGHEIWHADLYRLSDPQEVDELGLIDAFDTAICLVEWPDRLGDEMPARALWLSLRMVPGQDDARALTISSDRTDLWVERLSALVPA